MNNLFQRKQSNRSCRSENNTNSQHLSLVTDKFSLRCRGTRFCNVMIDQGLYPNDSLELSQSKLDDTIHELKRFLLLIPDDNLFEILNC